MDIGLSPMCPIRLTHTSARPADMESKGAPLPSAASSVHAPLSSAMMGVAGVVMMYAFVASSIG